MSLLSADVRQEASVRAKHWILIGFLLCLFVGGFLLGEDARGGLIRQDLYLFHGPTILAFRERPWVSVLADYNSATTPLFHILQSFNPFFGHDTAFRASNVVIALLTVAGFVFAMIERFRENPKLRLPALLIGASMLLSPYFRAEAFWASTDILPISLLLIAAMLLMQIERLQETGESLKPMLFIAVIAAVSWGTFYCRQTYFFAPVYACILLLLWYRRLAWFTSAVFAVLAIPALYLFNLWKGLNPPQFQHHERIWRDGIVAPFSMVFLYALPFLLEAAIARRDAVVQGLRELRRFLPWALAGWLIFLAIFRNYSFDQRNRGGGTASRLLSGFGELGELSFLTCGYLGLLVICWLLRGSAWRGRLLLVLFLLPAVAMSRFYQRYYDPLLVVIFFVFAERRMVRPFIRQRMAFLLMGFNTLLLAGAIFFSSHQKPVFLPLYGAAHPWDGTPLSGKVH